MPFANRNFVGVVIIPLFEPFCRLAVLDKDFGVAFRSQLTLNDFF